MSEPEHSVPLQKETCVKQSPSSYIFRVPNLPLIGPVLDRVTINLLPDDVLLEIFVSYKNDRANQKSFTWTWTIPIQVCRRWRHLIFESPRSLDIQLVCTATTPTGRLLDFMPPFPITVFCSSLSLYSRMVGVENLITALERQDRTSHIYIYDIYRSELPELIAIMDKPRPILTKFALMMTDYHSTPVLPKTFLGGSAPSLRSFTLAGVQFPTFLEFILSSIHIIDLALYGVGYISPEVMASCLAALPNLCSFHIQSLSPLSHAVQEITPPLTRAALPALTHFSFHGASEYFETLVAKIDTPVLKRLFITFFIPTLEIPRLYGFVNLIESLGPFDRADIEVSDVEIKMACGSPTRFKLAFACQVQGRPLSLMTQILSHQLLLLSHVEQLEIREHPWAIEDPVMDSPSLLELFRLFIDVKSLYISGKLVATVAVALKELTMEKAKDVFPALCNVYLEGLQSSGSVQELINPFVAFRQLSDHPIVIQSWERQLSDDDS